MRAFKKPSHRVAVAALLLLTMLAWHAEAIAAQLTLTWNNAVDAGQYEFRFYPNNDFVHAATSPAVTVATISRWKRHTR